MRLIDADKLKKDVLDWENCYNGFSDTYDKARIIDEIDEQPTIKAEPIKYGKWIEVRDIHGFWDRCSVCGTKIRYDIDKYSRCPSCGARMEIELDKEIME